MPLMARQSNVVDPFQGGMGPLVIASDIGQQAAPELFECVEVFATMSSDELKK